VHIYLGHGASGDAASMRPFVDGLRRRGLVADAVDLPKRRAEDVVPVWRAAVPDGPATIVGGHSYGGRVASLAAAASGTTASDAASATTAPAAPDAGYAGLVLFSYPLHPPGRPERTEARIAHWPAIECPVLLLSGEADPFARIELLRISVGLLPEHELVTYPKLGHTLRPVLEDVLDRVRAFVEALPASVAGRGR
jgi:predicted alpha/beta-hydrolase family hydrolase